MTDSTPKYSQAQQQQLCEVGEMPPVPVDNIEPDTPRPSWSPQATDSTHSPLPKGTTLPSTTRLSPSEIESLRQESREAMAWMKAQRGK